MKTYLIKYFSMVMEGSVGESNDFKRLLHLGNEPDFDSDDDGMMNGSMND